MTHMNIMAHLYISWTLIWLSVYNEERNCKYNHIINVLHNYGTNTDIMACCQH